MTIKKSALAAYKKQPVIVISAGAKIEICFSDGSTKKVRTKDIEILHPGPVKDLSAIIANSKIPDYRDAWELLQGEVINIEELTELVSGNFSPENVISVYRSYLSSGLFYGEISEIHTMSEEEVQEIEKKRKERKKTEEELKSFVKNIKSGHWGDSDLKYIQEIEQFTLNQMPSSRLLKALGIPSLKENAHKLLLNLSVWNQYVNPYPIRAGLTIRNPEITSPEIPEIERKDLTHFEAFAIDNSGCNDPDDAITIDSSGNLWVHVADPASAVKYDSEIDLEARSRGSNCYMPEKTLTMMPEKITQIFGLGLHATSPALSFKISFNDDGTPTCSEIVHSTVAVKMISYEDAEDLLGKKPFSVFAEIAECNKKRRMENGACDLSFPELKIKAIFPENTLPLENSLTIKGRDKVPLQLEIAPLNNLKIRDIVAEMMIITGEAVANFMYEKEIKIPYVSQPPPEDKFPPEASLSEQFKYRKTLKKSELHTFPSLHSGLGIDIYTRVTSPLRRYSDLLVHHQINAYLSKTEKISEEAILSAMSEAEDAASSVNVASRDSYKHWTLAELLSKKGYISEGVVLEVQERRCRILIPEFAIEVMVRGVKNLKEDQKISLELKSVNLPELESNWTVI